MTNGSSKPGVRDPLVASPESERQRLLLEIANLLTTKLEPDLLFDAIARVLRRFVKIDRASIALYDRERDEFEIVALALQESSRIGKGWSIPHRGSRIGKVFDSQRPYLSGHVGSPAGFFEDPQLLREGMHTSLVVPLLADGEPIGSFNVNCRREAGLSRSDVELLTSVGNQIAIAVANSRVFDSLRRHAEGLKRENAYLLELAQGSPVPNWVLNCPSMFAQLDRLMLLAKADMPVLLTGEPGTGKTVMARTLHSWGPRRRRPFVHCDCAALSHDLVERELFGQEEGVVAGTASGRIGRFELANASTLYLHEVAEIPLETQKKLACVLRDRRFTRAGGRRAMNVDVRVIASSSRDLSAETKAGRFHRELLEWLSAQQVLLRPLRERPMDVLPLAEQFLALHRRSLGRRAARFSAGSQSALRAHPWPGNVRELDNTIERALLLGGDVEELEITEEMLSGGAGSAQHAPTPALRTLAEVEADHIRRVLRETRGRISGPKGAALILGINASTLRSRMLKLGVRVERS